MYILTTLEFPKHNHDFYILTVSVNAKYYYNNYHKLTAGAQQNLGKLIIAGKLSGPSLVVTRRPLGELTRASATCSCVCKSTQHNVCIYRSLKANECSYVYIEGNANIL